MMLITEQQSSFDIVPAGTHVARCYRFIDLGTQDVTWQGETKSRHQVMLGWELPEELMHDGRPYSMHQTYTWSMHEKSRLRQDLESWRGRKFGPDDFHGDTQFDTKGLLGVPCLLTVIHNDKGYANIAAISPLAKGMQCAPAVNKPVYLSLLPDRWNAETFASLSDKLKSKIAASPEYARLFAMPGDDDQRDINDYLGAG
jgi:hypothetical protein